MGKIVALGGGRYDNGEMTSVAEHIMKLSGKASPNILFVPTASFDSDYLDSDERKCFESLGVEQFGQLLLDQCPSDEEIRSLIDCADIIYVGGGNLVHLIDTWKKYNVDSYLKEAFTKGKVLCGSSSGAMCWFAEGYDDCGPDGTYMFYDCLGLIPFTSCPHYQSENWQTFENAIKGRALSGIAMDNGAGFCYVDGEYYTVCGNEDGDCYYYDKDDSFKKHNLTAEKMLLKKLDRV